MGTAAVEHVFTGTTTPYASYNQDLTTIGPLIIQNTGSDDIDKWAGPVPIGFARPYEAAVANGWFYPHVISWSDEIDWVFLGDAAAAAATRRVLMYTYNRTTQTFFWNGFITITFPVATTFIIRSVRGLRYTYSTGTVGVSETTVTGDGTGWQTAGYAVGARIGFGTDDPTEVSNWYYISAITSDTEITLSGTPGTIASGTAFVIEEVRVVVVATNTTVTNGGLFLIKGLSKDDFSASGTNIPAATNVDNIKACYWLKDAATVTQTISAGVGLPEAASNSEHIIYCLNAPTTTTMNVYKYNLRAALTVSSGISTDAFVLKTGTSAATTGTIPQTNNGRFATAGHGPGKDIPSIYFVTVSRVYRIPERLIVDSATNFITDGMQEIPPGSISTYAATGALSSIEYGGTSDRFYITTSASSRQYYTKYNTNGDPWDYVWGSDTKQIDQSTADPGITPHPSLLATAISIHAQGGMLYVCRNGATAILHHLYAIPMGAHWDNVAVTHNCLITPRLSTTKCQQFYRAYANCAQIVGSDTLGMPPEPFRIYARISGMDDNSGEWITIPRNGDLTGILPADYIQFKFEFKMTGLTCVGARIFSVSVTYQDDIADAHYQPSVTNSAAATATFAWRHAVAFGGAVPALRVRLYNAITDDLMIDDNTTSAVGTWERSTNGGSDWSAFATTDKGNETTYIRYTPASLPANTTVRALLTLA